ncbi:MAG TPA: 4-hydroxy-tetrahydrodipicolinate reductase [Clostridiaceae bacterium]|nr:4-hydroxy-tetrahydrodipicolinate reductase [Clostridiaceae bacterium]
MIKVLLSGCNGRMGQTITRLSVNNNELKIVAGFDINDSIKNDYPVFTNIEDCNIEADVIIDFSNPNAFESIIKYAVSRKVPLVLATTGLAPSQRALLNKASEQIPVFFAANMSYGVNLLIDLVKRASKALEGSFDIEIIEKHHNQKLDAPSGTALEIANAINSVLDQKQEYIYDRHSRREKRSKNEIGIHAVRGGTIVGEHTVIFAGNDEIIEIKHTAMSREIFASGALRAAKFLYDKKPGLYNMTDLIESNTI